MNTVLPGNYETNTANVNAGALDNPVWSALLSGNKWLAKGTRDAHYFSMEVSLFAGIPNNTAEYFEQLHTTLAAGNTYGLMSTSRIKIPKPWRTLHEVAGLQMLYTKSENCTVQEVAPLTQLHEQHVGQMMALTALTRPGPFGAKTYLFGNYFGIFDGDELVAMAGQRLHADNFIEVSAVCTNPAYLKRGYAQQLIQHEINVILAQGCTPFLHVKGDNENAIRLYKKLGFATRSDMYFYFIQK